MDYDGAIPVIKQLSKNPRDSAISARAGSIVEKMVSKKNARAEETNKK